jgi:hypothetical protein
MVREHAAISASRNRIERPSAHMRDLGELLDRAAEDHRRLGEIEEELAMLRRNSDVPTEGPRQQLDEEEAAKRKPRRWWKGIGQIVQGAGISLGDAAVAAGFGAAGVAPAWAALVSVTVGVGTIMAAIGDLRDE